MVNQIEKEYNNLYKKYKLPNFKQIDEEFEISDLESTNFLMSGNLRRIGEKLEFYANIINDLLQPDTSSISGMHETRFFTEDEKNEIYVTFKRLMKLHRTILESVLNHDEKNQAEFLKDFFIEWIKIKKELLVYISKMKDSWVKETTIDEYLSYFG